MFVWCLCGVCIVPVWCLCGVCVVLVWCLCGVCVVFVWCLCWWAKVPVRSSYQIREVAGDYIATARVYVL